VTQFLADHDQLYWNALGHYWRLPTDEAVLRVHLPPEVPASIVTVEAYAGGRGANLETVGRVGKQVEPSAIADGFEFHAAKLDEIVAGQRGPRASQPMQANPAQAAPPPAPEPTNPTNPTLPVIPAEPPTAQIPTGSYSSYTQPAPSMPVAPTTPPRTAGPQLDWGAIVTELQAMAEDALGNRARKVKDILGAADPSLPGIEAAIDQIPSISLLFVDSSRLEQLAQEMRARLKSHL